MEAPADKDYRGLVLQHFRTYDATVSSLLLLLSLLTLAESPSRHALTSVVVHLSYCAYTLAARRSARGSRARSAVVVALGCFHLRCAMRHHLPAAGAQQGAWQALASIAAASGATQLLCTWVYLPLPLHHLAAALPLQVALAAVWCRQLCASPSGAAAGQRLFRHIDTEATNFLAAQGYLSSPGSRRGVQQPAPEACAVVSRCSAAPAAVLALPRCRPPADLPSPGHCRRSVHTFSWPPRCWHCWACGRWSSAARGPGSSRGAQGWGPGRAGSSSSQRRPVPLSPAAPGCTWGCAAGPASPR
jgi:hypothetical protein